MSEKRFCPVCAELANSPHHVKPRSLGGTDEPRNIRWFCNRCHDYIERLQEERGIELSPALLDEARREFKIKLDNDNSDGVEESWIGDDFLVWVHRKGETKRDINQYIGPDPDYLYEKIPSTASSNVQRKRRGRGRPLNDKINTGYLNELVFNKGLSLRQVVKQLASEGFHVSHVFVRDRLRNVPLDFQRNCKYCGNLYQPNRRNSAYCSPECDALDNRHGKRFISGEKHGKTKVKRLQTGQVRNA